mmetsp:Transcript_20701/g.36805  ORF Transcript_20701/g.36805 Transcript_20701/m.36805 type:complete len:574 (-) Transcript_20701:24-1745(-)
MHPMYPWKEWEEAEKYYDKHGEWPKSAKNLTYPGYGQIPVEQDAKDAKRILDSPFGDYFYPHLPDEGFEAIVQIRKMGKHASKHVPNDITKNNTDKVSEFPADPDTYYIKHSKIEERDPKDPKEMKFFQPIDPDEEQKLRRANGKPAYAMIAVWAMMILVPRQHWPTFRAWERAPVSVVAIMAGISGAALLTRKLMRTGEIRERQRHCQFYFARPPVQLYKLKCKKKQKGKFWWDKDMPCAYCRRPLREHDKRSNVEKDMDRIEEWQDLEEEKNETMRIMKAEKDKMRTATFWARQPGAMWQSRNVYDKQPVNKNWHMSLRLNNKHHDGRERERAAEGGGGGGLAPRGKLILSSRFNCEPQFLKENNIKFILNMANSSCQHSRSKLGSMKGLYVMNLNVENLDDDNINKNKDQAHTLSSKVLRKFKAFHKDAKELFKELDLKQKDQQDAFDRDLRRASAFILFGLRTGASVMVHGDTDMSRPLAATLGYLMADRGIGLKKSQQALLDENAGYALRARTRVENRLTSFEQSKMLSGLRRAVRNNDLHAALRLEGADAAGRRTRRTGRRKAAVAA